MADMQELIARLEAAEAGSRELDDAVWFFSTGEKPCYPFEDETDPHVRHGTFEWVHLPRVTTNIDAALSLAERVMGHREWRLEKAETYPLALCIAILKAKAQGEVE